MEKREIEISGKVRHANIGRFNDRMELWIQTEIKYVRIREK